MKSENVRKVKKESEISKMLSRAGDMNHLDVSTRVIEKEWINDLERMEQLAKKEESEANTKTCRRLLKEQKVELHNEIEKIETNWDEWDKEKEREISKLKAEIRNLLKMGREWDVKCKRCAMHEPLEEIKKLKEELLKCFELFYSLSVPKKERKLIESEIQKLKEGVPEYKISKSFKRKESE